MLPVIFIGQYFFDVDGDEGFSRHEGGIAVLEKEMIFLQYFVVGEEAG
jgi:hypothetical protein